jgi:hypothetical protein
MTETNRPQLRPWSNLDTEEQTALRISYGHYLDQLPPTCSMETKQARFRAWLAQQGIGWDEPGATAAPRDPRPAQD